MNNISKLEFISELNELANSNSNNLCLFLGAGADVSSGGALFSDLKKESVSFVRNQQIHSFESLELIDKEFNDIIENLDEQARCSVIQRLIKKSEKWMPSDGYKLLILLAKEHCISSVITTNFANLLEKTQELMRLDAFQIFTPATAIPAQYFMSSKHQKSIYLKMHGDLDGKLVTHLTTNEIQNKDYQNEFVRLFEHLIQNETIVFLGYSGWDYKIAELFEHNISNIKTVYWCNIKEPDEKAPLVKTFRKHNVQIKFINYNFDKALQIMAAEFFKERTLFHADSIFIWALIKPKIKKLQTEFLETLQKESNGLYLIPRTKTPLFDDFILDNKKNFSVISGNSGVGKSHLILELCNKFEKNEDIWIIPINAMTTYSNDLLDYIVKKLGYVSKDSYTVLYQFASWAFEQNKTFIFVVDNLGNHVGTSKEIAALLNKLIELSYIIRKYSCIKFIITLRTDIWSNVYQLLDKNYLSSIIWSEDKNNNYAIRLGLFDDSELKHAKKSIATLSSKSYISNDMTELLKDPSLYGLIHKNISSLEYLEEINIYTIFERTFFHGMAKTSLERLAYSHLCIYVEEYIPSKLTDSVKNYLKNNNTLSNILSFEEENISFKNNTILECCLSSFFVNHSYIDYFLHNVDNFEQEYLAINLPKPLYWGIIRYLSIDCHDFGKVIRLCFTLLNSSVSVSKYILKFINDIFRYMGQYNSSKFGNNIMKFDSKHGEFAKLLPFFIHSTGFMKDENAFLLLSYLRNVNFGIYALECNFLINDRFTIGLRESKNIQECNQYYNTYISYILIPNKPLLSLFALLWIMGRVGKDNVTEKIYDTIASLVFNSIKSLNYKINNEDIKEVKDVFVKNAYFIFFNSDVDIEEQYLIHKNRNKMIYLFQRVSQKEIFHNDDLKMIHSMTNHFGETIEFFFCNLLFVYMTRYDYDFVSNNLNALYGTFNTDTSPIELDFYSSVLFMSSYAINPLERQNYLQKYYKMVKDFEMKMFISPSQERVASCRKFEDKFEIEFEDGFNILTDYTYTAPIEKYIYTSTNPTINNYLSILWELLTKLENKGLYDEILQIIKAINQMSVNWPKEALEALDKFLKYEHPMIRRAIIRTLKENYLRYPQITLRFLEQTGGAFTEDEFLEIYSATESQTENRTLEQLQWARILYYISHYMNPNISKELLKIFVTTNSLYEVFEQLIDCLIQRV